MVFLMQYLDDELCNQICVLLINFHMEDRSKELEKKEIEKSGIFKSASKSGKESGPILPSQALLETKKGNDVKKLKKDKSMEDLLSSYGNSLYEEDLAIDENYTLEQYTLQKITLEWLNWNAQFFDYSDEPYLFYLAEILSKDFSKDDTGQLFYNSNILNQNNKIGPGSLAALLKGGIRRSSASKTIVDAQGTGTLSGIQKNAFDVYSPFRSILNLANLISKDQNFSINNLLPVTTPSSSKLGQGLGSAKDPNLLGSFQQGSKELLNQFNQLNQKPGLTKLLGVLASKEFLNKNENL